MSGNDNLRMWDPLDTATERLEMDPENMARRNLERMARELAQERLKNWVPTENEKVCQHIRGLIRQKATPDEIKTLTEALVDMAMFMRERGEKEYGPAE